MGIKKRFLCAVLAALIAGMSFVGCAGSWAATTRSTQFLGNLGGRWIGAVVYWIVGLPIVVPIAMTLDAILFNTIEWWTGSNLIGMGPTFEEADENGTRVAAVKNDDGTLSLSIVDINGNTVDFVLERDGNNVHMFDLDGNFIDSYIVALE